MDYRPYRNIFWMWTKRTNGQTWITNQKEINKFLNKWIITIIFLIIDKIEQIEQAFNNTNHLSILTVSLWYYFMKELQSIYSITIVSQFIPKSLLDGFFHVFHLWKVRLIDEISTILQISDTYYPVISHNLCVSLFSNLSDCFFYMGIKGGHFQDMDITHIYS